METAPIRTLIYGSCVSRDVLRIAPEPFQLTGYIARQSWISAFTTPVPSPDLSHVASAFQARNLDGDFRSTARQLMRRHSEATDVLLIDIASDRHGVAQYGDGYVSLTPDHKRAFGGMIRGGRRVPFASPRHLGLFSAAVKRGSGALGRLGLMEKALVLRAPFTDVTTTGVPMKGGSVTKLNAQYEPYYEVLAAAGLEIVDLPAELAVADPGHTWGLAPDHYADPAYQWWAERIVNFARPVSY